MSSQTQAIKLLLTAVGASVINLETLLPAKGAALLSVDTDSVTPGIQSELTVERGDTFTVEVLLSDNGTAPTPTVFDTVVLETFFNNAGAVLDLGPTGPIAGAIASTAGTLDIFGSAPTVPGATLATGSSFPAPPFTSGSGAIGLLNSMTFTITPGAATSIFRIDLTASIPGTSTILAAGSPENSPELALDGISIPVTLAPGTIIVTGTTTPVPEAATGLGSALVLGLTILGGKPRQD